MRTELRHRNVYGFACANDLEKAKEAAFFEASPRISRLRESKEEQLIMTPSKNFLYHWSEETPWTEDFFQKTSEENSSGGH